MSKRYRLPTAPGSVIRRTASDGNTHYRILCESGLWVGQTGEQLHPQFFLSRYEVVFDAATEPPKPLPTTPGSVIERPDGYPRRVLVGNTWVCVSHDEPCGGDMPASIADEWLTGYEVRFDAGAKS